MASSKNSPATPALPGRSMFLEDKRAVDSFRDQKLQDFHKEGCSSDTSVQIRKANSESLAKIFLRTRRTRAIFCENEFLQISVREGTSNSYSSGIWEYKWKTILEKTHKLYLQHTLLLKSVLLGRTACLEVSVQGDWMKGLCRKEIKHECSWSSDALKSNLQRLQIIQRSECEFV